VNGADVKRGIAAVATANDQS